MNRELKFRIWDKHDEEFLELRDSCSEWAFVLCLNGDGVLQSTEDGNCRLPQDNFAIQQFTGLQDLNGKDIYEGDIVKTNAEKCISILFGEAGEYSAGEVCWWNEGFALCQKGVGATRISEYSECGCCPSGLEIIGNIFENPELCEK